MANVSDIAKKLNIPTIAFISVPANFEGKIRALGGQIEKVSSEKEIQKFKLKVG